MHLKDPREQIKGDPFDEVMYQGQLEFNLEVERLLRSTPRRKNERSNPAGVAAAIAVLFGILASALILSTL